MVVLDTLLKMMMKQKSMRKKTKITTCRDKNSTFGQKHSERCFSVQLTAATSDNTINWGRENSDLSFCFGSCSRTNNFRAANFNNPTAGIRRCIDAKLTCNGLFAQPILVFHSRDQCPVFQPRSQGPLSTIFVYHIPGVPCDGWVMNSVKPVETCSTLNLSATSMSLYIVGSIPTYVSCLDNLNQFGNTKKQNWKAVHFYFMVLWATNSLKRRT